MRPLMFVAVAALSLITTEWSQRQLLGQPLDHAAATHTAAPPAPEDGGPRRWEVAAPGGVDLRKAPSAQAPMIDTLPQGSILANRGCVQADGQVWCAVQRLRERRRGYVAASHLQPARGPDGTVAFGPDDSALRARQGAFDATGQIPCAQIRNEPWGEPWGACTYAVARGTGGDATVIVTFANGFRRVLSFAHGVFIRGDTTMSGTGFDTDWRIEDGQHVIRVDDQRFLLPAAAILGQPS